VCSRTCAHMRSQLPAVAAVSGPVERLRVEGETALNGCMEHDESDESPANEYDTRMALLKNAKRSAVPLRKTFVQKPRSRSSSAENRAGPLSGFVVRGDRRALDAYLILLAAISSGGENGDDWSTRHPIMVFARAFGTTLDAERASAATAVSKTLRRLEDRNLIERSRSGRERKIKVRLLREDGSGEPYTRPSGTSEAERFLQLNHVYWQKGWIDKLKMPGLAMLLVALHEKPGFTLPTEKVPMWYGWSADTAERGLAELQDLGLLHKVQHRRKEPLSASGFGLINHYFLLPPFGNLDALELLADHVNAEASFERSSVAGPK